MNPFRQTLLKGLQSIGLAVLCLLFLSNALFTSTVSGNERIVIQGSHIFTAIGGVALVAVVLYLCNRIKSKPMPFLVISQLIYGACALLWIHTSTVAPFADQGSVYQAALNFNAGQYKDFLPGGYLYQYNHQIPLTLMFALLLKVFGSHYEVLQLFIGACGIGVNVGLYMVTKELYSEKAAGMVLVLSMLFVPTLMLTTYVYGDIIGLSLSVWAIYGMIQWGKEGKVRFALISSMSIGAAMLFRYNTILVLAAMVIYILLSVQRRKLLILLILLASLGFTSGVKEFASVRTGSSFDGGIPSVLFVNMGLEEGPRADGWYNSSTVRNYNAAGKDSRQAEELGIALVQERLAYMSSYPLYTLKFFSNKFITTWTEPSFEALYFTMPHNQAKEVTAYYKSSPFLNSLYYGSLNNYVLIFCKGLVLMILLGALAGYTHRGQLSPEMALILLVVLGTIAFHLIWETKSRYVFPAFVLLFPLAAGYWSKQMDVWSTMINRRRGTELQAGEGGLIP